MAIREPIQVELISEWWEQLLPMAALGLSLLSLGLTLWFRFSDRLKLSVSMTWSMYLDSMGGFSQGSDRLNIIVTNRSRTAITQVTELTLQLPSGGNFARVEPGITDDALPITLGPGESASVSYETRGVGITLNGEAKEAAWVRGRAVCGHRTVLGKKDRKTADQLRTYANSNPTRPR